MNSTAESRLYYFDNLRAFAMIAGVFFHAALAYSPMLHGMWLTADTQQSTVVDWISWFTHLFRMPLFFVIAGFFVAYLITKRGMGGMIWNRTKRIVFPFIIFWPLCMWAVVAEMVWAATHVEQKSPLLQMIAYSIANPGTPPPPPTTMHLWFLYNLILFCIFTWILSYVNFNWIKQKFSQLHPVALLIIFPLVLTPALTQVPAPMPAPESFFPQLWSFGFFGLFFAAGYFIFQQENFLDKFKNYSLILLIGSLLAYAYYFSLLPDAFGFIPPENSLSKTLALGFLEAIIACWMTLFCLITGKKFLNFRNRFLRFLSDSSYWIYIVHLPIVFAVQYKLMDAELSLGIKYSLSVAITLSIAFASYLILVRWTPIGWLLNGRKK
jgi:glucans biosynthesis protein C